MRCWQKKIIIIIIIIIIIDKLADHFLHEQRPGSLAAFTR